MTKILMLVLGVTFSASAAATDLAPKIHTLLRVAEKEIDRSVSERSRLLAASVLKMLGGAQAAQAEPLRIDARDAAAVLKAMDQFGPVIMGGRLGRQVEDDDGKFISMLDDEERQAWNLVDQHLDDSDREGLRRVYPVLAAAVLGVRPSILAGMINAHVAANNFDLDRTAAVYGKGPAALGLFTFVVKAKLSRFFGKSMATDLLYAQTFVALARYLKVPEQSGFCQTKFDRP